MYATTLRQQLADNGLQLSDSYPRGRPPMPTPQPDTYLGMSYADWQASQLAKGMLGGAWRTKHEVDRDAYRYGRIAAEGMLGVHDDVSSPAPWGMTDKQYDRGYTLKPTEHEGIQADIHGDVPDLPDIPNYDELLRTKAGRDEIRRIREQQLKDYEYEQRR